MPRGPALASAVNEAGFPAPCERLPGRAGPSTRQSRSVPVEGGFGKSRAHLDFGASRAYPTVMNPRAPRGALLFAMFAFVLAGCGGGGSQDSAPGDSARGDASAPPAGASDTTFLRGGVR